MYYPSIQTNSLGPGFSALPMNPLLDVHEQEHGWKSELQEHDRDFSVGRGFWMWGQAWEADSKSPISNLGTDMAHVT